MLLIHGDDDRNVPFQQTTDLVAKLRVQNVAFKAIGPLSAQRANFALGTRHPRASLRGTSTKSLRLHIHQARSRHVSALAL